MRAGSIVTTAPVLKTCSTMEWVTEPDPLLVRPNTTAGFHHEARAVSNGSGGRVAGGVGAIVTRQGRARDRAGAPRPGARAAGAVRARCAAADQLRSGADRDARFRFSPRLRHGVEWKDRRGPASPA